jgi:nucleotidyltransferase AbiEii toxin of type IV toxin-antitoxin system
MDLHPDFRDLLAEFVRSKVRFVLLGGYAVGIHAKPRATKDLDLLVSGEGGNLERVSEALLAFGAPAVVVNAARNMGPSEIVYLGVPPVRIDILRQADGIDTESVIARAQSLTLGALVVPVIAIVDLIANKRATGRPQDLADVALLERKGSGLARA